MKSTTIKMLLECVCETFFFFQYEMPFVIIIQLAEGGRERGRESFIDWS